MEKYFSPRRNRAWGYDHCILHSGISGIFGTPSTITDNTKETRSEFFTTQTKHSTRKNHMGLISIYQLLLFTCSHFEAWGEFVQDVDRWLTTVLHLFAKVKNRSKRKSGYVFVFFERCMRLNQIKPDIILTTYVLHELNNALCLSIVLVVEFWLVKECDNLLDISELLLVASIFRFRNLVLVVLEPLRILSSTHKRSKGALLE